MEGRDGVRNLEVVQNLGVDDTNFTQVNFFLRCGIVDNQRTTSSV